MLQASNEQLLIAQNSNNHNIIVEAVAGSGKTATTEHIALLHPLFKS